MDRGKITEGVLKIAEMNKPLWGDVVDEALELFKEAHNSTYKKEAYFTAILYVLLKERNPFIKETDIKVPESEISKGFYRTVKKVANKLKKTTFWKPISQILDELNIDKELLNYVSTRHPKTLTILSLYARGMSVEDIANLVNCKVNYVKKVISLHSENLNKYLIARGYNGVDYYGKGRKKAIMDARLANC